MKQSKGMKIVLLMCLGIFLCMLDTTIMNIALPAIQTDLGTSLEKLSWILNVYTITIAVLSIPLGRMAEIFGKGKIYVSGLVLFGGASLLCGLATSGEYLIFARFIQSIGAAIIFPTAMIIGVSAVSIEKRGIALTLLGVTQGLSAAIGPIVGGIITEAFGWRWVFTINVPICILAIILCCLILDLRNEERVHTKIDWLGVILCSISIFCLTLVLVKGNTWGWTNSYSLFCYFSSIVSLILFIVTEMKVSNPMINLKLFKDRTFVGAATTLILCNIFLIGVNVLLPTFLTKMQGKSELNAALLITPIFVMIFFMAPIAGGLIRKIGNATVFFIGFLFMTGAYVLLKDITVSSSMLRIIIVCLLLGTGYGLIVGPVTTLGASSFEGELLTASQSVLSMFRQVGIALAIAIFVSTLTNNLNNKQADILIYAKKQVESLEVEQSVKSSILDNVQKKLKDPSLNKNSILSQKEATLTLEQRDKIIKHNVEIELNKLPLEMRNGAKEQVEKEVTSVVDSKNEKLKKQIELFRNDVSNYAENKMAEGFADLYKMATPLVLISACISILLFRTGKRKQIQHNVVRVTDK
ncbi:DHA2 family efflux MFS transporter permease subunit [Bacillus cereus group sp. N34]|uniref:MFS transporter n=1 Tax=Bacillus cereus group sp. N34 TaxID=2794595 RepID=UPI0018F5899E|nr:MFS transporter [Bacillus cereus group sp. N34]MBJ8015088.1 DHA2 family efflux MFS transporter permease subunit [Bacillus cereus group sp. N34]